MGSGTAALRAIIEEQDALAFRELQSTYFQEDELNAYTFVADYVRQYGRLPSIETVQENSLTLSRRTGPVRYHMDRLLDRVLYNDLNEEVQPLVAAMSNRNMQAARTIIKSMSAKARDRESGAITQSIGRVAADLLAKIQSHEPFRPGVPFGYTPLDEATMGQQPGDLNVFVGRPNVGKSFFLLSSLMAGWQSYRTPLVITMEMNVTQLATRMVGLHTGINTKFIRQRQLSTRAIQNIAECVTDFQLLPPLTFVSGHRMPDVGMVEALINETQPDIVYIDAAYLIKARHRVKGSKWEHVAEVMEELKSIAERTGVPICITVQFSRAQGSKQTSLEGTVDRIGGSDTIGQLASVVVGIAPAPGNDQHTRRVLRLDKNREGPKAIEWWAKFEFNPMDFSETPATISESETQRRSLVEAMA